MSRPKLHIKVENSAVLFLSKRMSLSFMFSKDFNKFIRFLREEVFIADMGAVTAQGDASSSNPT